MTLGSKIEPGPASRWADQMWDRAMAKLRVSRERIGASFPHATREGRYDSAPPYWWTAGFWPGLLWLGYRGTQDPGFRGIAEECEHRLDHTIMEFDELYHDVGFMWSLTSVARYKLLGSDDSRRRALVAASLLAARFNLRGRFLRAWNEDKTGWAIIDSLMNLPLLHWASEVTRDPRFSYIAMAHADTALRDFVREDGSCRHIVRYDPVTGSAIESLAGQGFSAESAWSRGTAWAVYGFALNHRYTEEQRYLDAARRTADYFLAHLPPDRVPPWDFSVPVGPDVPRDSSASACCASGLIELSRALPSSEGAPYLSAAIELLRALEGHCCDWSTDTDALLRFGAGNVPEGQNVNVSLIYGDYFFVEALAKLRGEHETFW